MIPPRARTRSSSRQSSQDEAGAAPETACRRAKAASPAAAAAAVPAPRGAAVASAAPRRARADPADGGSAARRRQGQGLSEEDFTCAVCWDLLLVRPAPQHHRRAGASLAPAVFFLPATRALCIAARAPQLRRAPPRPQLHGSMPTARSRALPCMHHMPRGAGRCRQAHAAGRHTPDPRPQALTRLNAAARYRLPPALPCACRTLWSLPAATTFASTASSAGRWCRASSRAPRAAASWAPSCPACAAACSTRSRPASRR